VVSYDEPPTPPAQPAQGGYPPPAGYPPPGYAPQAPPPRESGTSGWLIAIFVVIVLALGGLAAAIISKGDDGKTATVPTVTNKTTTVQATTTVTTPAAPANVTVAPNVTLDPSGAPEPVQTSTDAQPTSTP
jgi:hypothetical protein